MPDDLPIKGIDYIELYVGNARQAVHYFRAALGFELIAYASPETGMRDRVSYMLRQENICFVLTSPINPTSEVAAHVHMHSDGIRAIALTVDDASKAFQYAMMRGARPYLPPIRKEDEQGDVILAGIHIYGDTVHFFVERQRYQGIFLPGYDPIDDGFQPQSTGLIEIDHLMGNVGWMERDQWCEFYQNVLGFQVISPFNDRDISGRTSILMSKDASEHHPIRFPITEPADGKNKTRVETFLTYYKGPGVQHIALRVADILSTVRELIARGVNFQQVKSRPHEALIEQLGHDMPLVKELHDLGIMVDLDAESFLLQIFTVPLGDRPTVCFEIIQRVYSTELENSHYKPLFDAIVA